MKKWLFSLCLVAMPMAVQAASLKSVDTALQECHVTGSVTLYDEQADRWYESDAQASQYGTLPASTFKITNSLIALQEKAVKDEHEVLKWDGIIRKFPYTNKPLDAWNHDTDMQDAIKNSTVWFYERMAERVGTRKYADYLKKLDYGNGNITHGKGVNFWVYGDFQVTPNEQINLLRRLKHDDLPFSEKVIETVKRITLIEQKGDKTIHGKTGWTDKDEQNIGWWVGYVEQGERTIYFATRIFQSIPAQDNFSACRKDVTNKALAEIGVKG